MFWILRRTRLTSAVQFFNAINNNSGNNASTETRPARKEYSKLAGDENEAACTHAHNENNLVMDNAICDDKNNMVEDSENMHSTDLLDTDTDSSCTDIDYDHDNRGHEVFSDDSDYDESLTCNVCDRSFPCHRQLASHKQKKRHFGCSACDSLFPSLMALEHHKEEFEHWSGDEDICTDSEDDDSDLTVASEEMERLL